MFGGVFLFGKGIFTAEPLYLSMGVEQFHLVGLVCLGQVLAIVLYNFVIFLQNANFSLFVF